MWKYGIIVFGWLALIPHVSYGKTWRGITPLISTRSEVEKLLGKPNVDNNTFDVPEGRAIINYSDGKRCEEGVPGFGNIPRDTVVEIYLSFKKETKLAELLVAGQDYVQTQAVHTPHVYYTNKAEGIRFASLDGIVLDMTYFGTAADQAAFSCGEYKYAAPIPSNPDPVRVEQYPFDSFGNIQLEDAKARLDNFVIQLLQLNAVNRQYRAFIIVYGGKSAYAREPEQAAECYKNYLVKTREADSETIVAVAGGYQDEFQVELYIIPINSYPPVLMPTVSPKKIKTLQGQFKCR